MRASWTRSTGRSGMALLMALGGLQACVADAPEPQQVQTEQELKPYLVCVPYVAQGTLAILRGLLSP
jgi:hypothetical protein